MAKQLNIDLNFRANTTQAQKSIIELQSALQQIATAGTSGLNIDSSKMKAASEAAKELSIHLNNAFNAETGNFDLSKLDRSLKTSSTNITELSSKLLNVGAAGEQAFVKLAQTIAAADRPVVTLNSKLTGLLTTLKNTARWQISSSILHGFMGAVQSAYGYAQDLNKSLNDIRIVSGQNTEQMAQFANEANRAAKNLSTTTNAYAKAALIFYQQGDSGSTITQKADVVTKMSNVTGQSADIVSNQLTSIWNNFNAAGNEAYEHYADVLTALGAATASSTDEIAGGLEKFAGIAETVGLSYDYAASALATITATSRQSEDVVGTALKTIFSRIQGLNLGETLDDGTTLNKYSEALMKVGISIKDQSGQIKAMDTILDEMGAKWNTLNKDQQMALAQTVAGVRQYNQLITLMNNWDFMQKNVDTAQNSTGELQKQQEIYEESWKAANDRVRASMEAIYTDIIDDKFFIEIANGFASLLDSVDAFIDGMGGIKTLAIGIGSIILNSVANKITPALQNLKHTFSVVFQSAERQAKTLANEMNESIVKTMNSQDGQNFTDSSKTALQNAMQLNVAKAKLQTVENNLTAIEKQRYQQDLALLQISQDETQAIADKITKRKEEIALLATQLDYEQATKDLDSVRGREEEALRARRAAADEGKPIQEGDTSANLTQAILKHSAATDNLRAARESYTAALYESYTAEMETTNGNIANSQKEYEITKLMPGVLEEYSSKMESIVKSKKSFNTQIDGFRKIKTEIDLIVGDSAPALSKALSKAVDSKTPKELAANMQKVSQTIKKTKIPAAELEKILRKLGQGKNVNKLISYYKALDKEQQELLKKQEALNRALNAFNPKHAASSLETISKTASGLGQVAMAAQSIRSVFQAWNNDDLTIGEKITTTITGISMAIPGAIGGLKSLASALTNAASTQLLMAMRAEQFAENNAAAVATMTAEEVATKANISTDAAHLAIMQAKALVMQDEINKGVLKIETLTAETVAERLGISTDSAAIVISKLKAKYTLQEALTEAGLTTAKGAGTLATIAATIANWGFLASMPPLLAITLVFTAAIAALALIIWGVVAAFEAIQAASPEGQLKAAKERAAELNTALDAAKQAAEDLKSAFDKYDSAVKALEDCTEGAKEWYEALQNVNTEVLNLLSKHPELSTMMNEKGEKAITRGANGELVVADWAQEQLMSEANQAIINTQVAAIAANQEVREAETEVKRKDVSKAINKISGTTGTHYYTRTVNQQGGTKTEAVDASSMISNHIAQNIETLGDLTPDEQKAALQKYFDQSNITADVDAWVAAIEELGPEFGDLINSIEANTAATELENEIMAQIVLADQEDVQNSGLAEEITKITSQDFDKQIEAEKAAMDRWGKDYIWKSTGVNQEARDVFEEYAKAAGIKDYDLLDTTGNDENRKFVYNANGQETTVSLETMKSVVAASRANAKLAENASQLVATLANKTDAEVAAITAASTGNTQFLTVDQATGDYNIEALAKSLSEADLKAMGYKGTLEEMQAAYMEDYTKVAESGKIALEDSINDYVSTIETELNTFKTSGLLKDLTLAEVDALGQVMDQALIVSGTSGVQLVSDMFKKAQAEGFGDELVDVLKNVDWAAASPKSLTQALQDAGIEMEFSTEALQALIDTMDNSELTFDAATKKYKTLNDIIKDINTGDTISAEEFKALGDGYDDYFMRMADGTYKLTADAKKFYDLVHAQSIQGFKDIVTNLSADNNDISRLLKNFNFSKENLNINLKPLLKANDRMTMRLIKDDLPSIIVGNENNTTQDKLDLLSIMGASNEAKLADWQARLNAGTLTATDVVDISTAINEWTDSVGGADAAQKKLEEQLVINQAEIRYTYEAIASSATSISELNQMLEDGVIDFQSYNKAWKSLNEAMDLEGLDSEELQAYTEYLQETMGLSEDAAKVMAKSTMKMNNGVKSLSEGLEGWTSVLQQSSKSSQEYFTALTELRSAMASLLDISGDYLSESFLTSTKNMQLMEQAANGDAQAIDQLRQLALEDIVINLELKESASITNDELKTKVQNLQSMLDEMDLEAGIGLDDSSFISACNEMIQSAGLTTDQVNALFDGMGYEAKFKTEPQEITQRTPIVMTRQTIVDSGTDKNGAPYWTTKSETWNDGYSEEKGKVDAFAMAVSPDGTEVPQIESISAKATGSANNSSSGNPGSTNPLAAAENKTNRTKKDDVVERYKEWDDALDDVAYAMERVNKQADRLYGVNRINALKKQNELLLKQKELLTKKKGDVETDLKSDKNSLVNTAKAHGVNFKFDAQGNISNYTAEMTKLYNELAIKEAKWADASQHASKEAQDEYEENVVQPIRDKIDEIKEALGIYTDTRELIEDLQQQIDDAFYEWQDNNYEQIHYKLELELDINDTELRMINYYLNKIADDFYSMGEAAAKISTEKVDTLVNSLQDYEAFEIDLRAKFAAGDISQEKYVEGLKETFNGYLDNLEALQDLDKEMQHYYEDTLSAGAEELAVYTDHMEHLTSVLDHYQNIVTMMNGEMDFDNIGTILEGKASTLNNEMKVAESNYAMLKAEQAAMQAAYDAADEEGKKYLKSSLDAINAQVDEAHEAMLSKTKEWSEAQRAIMENSMKKAAHEMEMAFTNNMGFDALNSSMDRLSSYSNEYLTKTNQIYETQKLMNTAQQAIDKTTNQAAKVRLENYNKEIRQLQEKNKLSNLELDIAKAKYDVLLAEIALEEAQNSKATVRLQRDSEGNYGYVYTADKENIAKAEQDLADAQNALYNIGLEGANDYGSKLLDLQQQLADELIALEEARAAGQYKTDEEYYAAKERLISEYNNLFEAYSAQYTTALEVDTAIQQEAWVNAYDEMILKTEDLLIHVDEYTILCEESYSHWREIVQAESDIVTDLLGNVSDAVKNVTDESNNLKDKIVKEVIPAIENEYDQVRTAVLAYESLRAGLQLTIQRYEELAAAIQETMRQQALLEGQANTPEVPDIPEEFSPEEPDNKIGHSEMMDLVEDIMVHGSYANDPERTGNILGTGKYSAEDRYIAQQIVNDIAANEKEAWNTGKGWSEALDRYTKKHLGYDTGGYTGAWGPEGKLAWLHEKEIVLNARDTENFLAATGILRDISKMIDLNSIQNQMSQLSAVGMTNAAHQILEQAVSIEAHFPNVTDRNEIEEAFNNLINTASQYANRKF